MRNNPVQFAIVREDPKVDQHILERHTASRMILIGSGGCTALALKAWNAGLTIDLIDSNPAQLRLVREKIRALREGASLERFNVESQSSTGLSQCGNFESLFRIFRKVLEEMVLSASDLSALFQEEDRFQQNVLQLTGSKYWPVAFQLAFHDTYLRALFGPSAIQYAEPGSYPTYFQKQLERGLSLQGAYDNPFLHHIFLGKYLKRALPDYLAHRPTDFEFQWLETSLQDVSFQEYDWIGLSNILDWTSPKEVETLLTRLKTETHPGTTVVWRQLNNHRPLWEALSPEFHFDHQWEAELLSKDRSLFYSSLHIGHRVLR